MINKHKNNLDNSKQDLKNSQKNGEYSKVFILELNKLGKLFDYPIDKEKAQIYFESLSSKLSLNEFKKACNVLRDTFKKEFGLKFPLPHHFLDIFKEPENPELFDELYAQLEGSISYLTSLSQFTGDEDFKKLIRSQGGIFNLQRWTVDDWKFNRGRLKDGFVAIKEKKKKDEIYALPSGISDIKGLLGDAFSMDKALETKNS